MSAEAPALPAARRSGVPGVRQVGRILVLIAILAVALYPLLWMVASSFKSQTEISVAGNISLIPREFTPGNYREGWAMLGEPFSSFFINSLVSPAMTKLLMKKLLNGSPSMAQPSR